MTRNDTVELWSGSNCRLCSRWNLVGPDRNRFMLNYIEERGGFAFVAISATEEVVSCRLPSESVSQFLGCYILF